MRRISLFAFMLCMLSHVFSQTAVNKYPLKNGLQVSPAFTFEWSGKSKNNTLSSNFIPGFNINYIREDKWKNFHDAGVLIGIIPLNSKKSSAAGAKQIGVEYNYRLVFAKFKDNNLKIYTAIGTQLIYRKTQSTQNTYTTKTSNTNSFIHNFVVTPGFQYSKNNFFFDFSLPSSIGYNIRNTKISGPDLGVQPNPSEVHDSSQKSDPLNWNIGIKIGVGAKF